MGKLLRLSCWRSGEASFTIPSHIRRLEKRGIRKSVILIDALFAERNRLVDFFFGSASETR